MEHLCPSTFRLNPSSPYPLNVGHSKDCPAAYTPLQGSSSSAGEESQAGGTPTNPVFESVTLDASPSEEEKSEDSGETLCGLASSGAESSNYTKSAITFQQCVRVSNRKRSETTNLGEVIKLASDETNAPGAVQKAIYYGKVNRSQKEIFESDQYLHKLKRQALFNYNTQKPRPHFNDYCVKRVWNNNLGQFVNSYVPVINYHLVAGTLYTEVLPPCNRKTLCHPTTNSSLSSLGQWNLARQIYRANGVYSSMNTSKHANLAVSNPRGNMPPYILSQTLSDRNKRSVVSRQVPTRGNSTKSSITRMRPGSTCAPGVGVDVKHGSYARRLARLKGRMLVGNAARSLEERYKAAQYPSPLPNTNPYANNYSKVQGVWSGAPLPKITGPMQCTKGSCGLTRPLPQ